MHNNFNTIGYCIFITACLQRRCCSADIFYTTNWFSGLPWQICPFLYNFACPKIKWNTSCCYFFILYVQHKSWIFIYDHEYSRFFSTSNYMYPILCTFMYPCYMYKGDGYQDITFSFIADCICTSMVPYLFSYFMLIIPVL
jgi:hypothetical protein